jgi:threonine synthase
MDISKASNFERFIFDLLGRDGVRVKALFGDALARDGQFDLSQHPAFNDLRLRYGFDSGKSTHADRLACIKDNYLRHGMMIDTHTADGVKVALEHLQSGVPMIVLETALPIKFAQTIVEATGVLPERPAKFVGIEDLPKKVTPMAADVAAIKAVYRRKMCMKCAPAHIQQVLQALNYRVNYHEGTRLCRLLRCR